MAKHVIYINQKKTKQKNAESFTHQQRPLVFLSTLSRLNASLSSSVSFSSISFHNNVTFAFLAQQTHTHNRRTRQRRTIESQSNSTTPPSSFFYSNPTSNPHPIQLSGLLPSLCPFVWSFLRLSKLKSQYVSSLFFNFPYGFFNCCRLFSLWLNCY